MTVVADVVDLPADEPPRAGVWAEEHPAPTDEEVDVGERIGRVNGG